VNLAKLCKITFSNFSIKSFLTKTFGCDYLSDLTTHSQQVQHWSFCLQLVFDTSYH